MGSEPSIYFGTELYKVPKSGQVKLKSKVLNKTKVWNFKEVVTMEKEAYLTFEDHEDFRRVVEEALHDKKESIAVFTKS